MGQSNAYSDLRVFGEIKAGKLTIFGEYSLPTTDGLANQILVTDGAGNITFQDASAVALTPPAIVNGTGINWSTIAPNTVQGNVTLAPFSTTDLAEGVNLYYQDEYVDDRVNALLTAGTGITKSYNDLANTLTLGVTLAPFSTTNLAEGVNLYYTDLRVENQMANVLYKGGRGTGPDAITWTHIVGLNRIYPTVSLTPFSTDDLAEGVTNLYLTENSLYDLMDQIIQDSATVTWTRNNITNELTATAASSPLEVQLDGLSIATNPTLDFISTSRIAYTINDDIINSKTTVQIDVVNDPAVILEGTGTGSSVRINNLNNSLGDYSTVSGGSSNTASGDYSTIAGGTCNSAVSVASFVGGGTNNLASGDGAPYLINPTTVGPFAGAVDGLYVPTPTTSGSGVGTKIAVLISSNLLDAYEMWSVGVNYQVGDTITIDGADIGGVSGADDIVFTVDAVINGGASVVGGFNNDIFGIGSVISGGINNLICSQASTIGGGFTNCIAGIPSFTDFGHSSNISGGQCNTTFGLVQSIGGGNSNLINSFNSSTIAGGELNSIVIPVNLCSPANGGSAIGGGGENSILSSAATISGGCQNTVCGDYSTIGGGRSNTASGCYATVGGGVISGAVGDCSTIGGGYENCATNLGATIGGGLSNAAFSNISTIGGGQFNLTDAQGATIGGGSNNIACGDYSVVGGGLLNDASCSFSTISGGFSNTAGEVGATVGGGYDNTASGYYSTIGGGTLNTASNYFSTIGGGTLNTASGCLATVAGGGGNVASDFLSTISGGGCNVTVGCNSTIGGGYCNSVNGIGSTVGGGFYNQITGELSFIGAGFCNTATKCSVIAGGNCNSITGCNSAIGGGSENSVTACTSVISGGNCNSVGGRFSNIGGGRYNLAGTTAEQQFNVVSGGRCNSITAACSTIVGGNLNSVSCNLSAIGGGQNNTVAGNCSAILGGQNNSVTNKLSVISGGCNNALTSSYGAIMGGCCNTVSHDYSSAVGYGITSVCNNTLHVNCLNLYNTPLNSCTDTAFLVRRSDGMVAYRAFGGIFSQTAAGTTVTATVTETSALGTGVGTLTVPANGFTVGDSFVLHVTGTLSAANNETLTIKLKSGTTILATSGAITLPTITSKKWNLDAHFTVRAIGAAGVAQLMTSGSFTYNQNSGNSLEGSDFESLNTTTFDTTASNTLSLTVQWGSTNATNSIVTSLGILEKVF